MQSAQQPMQSPQPTQSTPQTPPQPTQSTQSAPQTPSAKTATSLGEFIQYGRNANIFYDHLANSTPSAEYREYLQTIGESGNNLKKICDDIFARSYAGPFQPRDTPIDVQLPFKDGVKRAIVEESRLLRELSEFGEGALDPQVQRRVQRLINDKISDLSMLHYINGGK
jgi:hypothetical protein